MWVEESFPLGTVTITKAAEVALLDAGLSCSAQAVLARHISGDWGNVPERQAKENDQQARVSGTVVSLYKLRRRKAVRVVTNITRGTTCVLAEAEQGEEEGHGSGCDRANERTDAPG